MKQWSSAVGQPHPPNASFPKPHTLAQVSLSISRDGSRALYNSIEGLTSLWNLENGEITGPFESYVRTNAEAEPCRIRVFFQYPIAQNRSNFQLGLCLYIRKGETTLLLVAQAM